jgi:hypothetical protein
MEPADSSSLFFIIQKEKKTYNSGMQIEVTLIANCSTEDGRLTKGQAYSGWIVHKGEDREIRFLTQDNLGGLMTFNITVFSRAK